MRSLPLDIREGFILSRIDGELDEHELAIVTGFDDHAIAECLRKLQDLGLIEYAQPPKDEVSQVRQVREIPHSEPEAHREDRVAFHPTPPPRSSDDNEPSSEAIPPALRRELDVLHAVLGVRTYYELVGVARDADKKTIKRAYYALASRYHPDRFFRKQLGRYKLMLEEIFGQITLAHDTLTNSRKREEYNTYLADLERTRDIEKAIRESFDEIIRVETVVVEESKAESVPPPPPPHVIEPAPGPSARRTPVPPKNPSSGALLARRLLGGRQLPPRDIGPMPSVSSLTTEQAMDALRRRYELRTDQARRAHAQKYAKQGEEALAKNDLIAAANAYRIALSLLPNDADLRDRQQNAQRAADKLLCDSYERQASYEEKAGNWKEAARNWTRVAGIRTDDAMPHQKAANALVRADGDLHEAKRLALRALELMPQDAATRVTLANVYMAAGLTLNAKRELEQAKQVLPNDATISAMLRRISKSL